MKKRKLIGSSQINKKVLLLIITLIIVIVGYAATNTNIFYNGQFLLSKGITTGAYVSYVDIDGDTENVTMGLDQKSFTLEIDEHGEGEADTNIINYRIVNPLTDYNLLANINCTSDDSGVSYINNNSLEIASGSTEDGMFTIKKTSSGTANISCVANLTLQEKNAELGFNLFSNRVDDLDDGTLFGNIRNNTLGENVTKNSGNGIFTLKNTGSDNFPVYYYRGNNSDNNVLVGDTCYKILRTTSKGGIKLIYNGIINSSGNCDNTGESTLALNSKYNENTDDNAYVGYMFGASSDNYIDTHANGNPSLIKTNLEEWFRVNMEDYQGYLEDSVYCNDREIDTSDNDDSNTKLGYKKNKTLYNPKYRLSVGNKDQVICENTRDSFTKSSDNGNGALSYPVGLITSDEVNILKANYLNNGTSYWTMSPSKYDGVAVVYSVSEDGNIQESNVVEELGVRPVITLKLGTKLISGDGTVNSPYIVTKYNSIVNMNLVTSEGEEAPNGTISKGKVLIKKNVSNDIVIKANDFYHLESYTCSPNITLENIEVGEGALSEQTFRAKTTEDLEGECSFVFAKNTENVFSFKNSEDTFNITNDGIYKLEVWGASGGNAHTYLGGYGAYSTGFVQLNKNSSLFINVGGEGLSNKTKEDAAGGYNGGGSVTGDNSSNAIYGTGGGATSIATQSGILSTINSNKVLIVAGGGGGAYYNPDLDDNGYEGNGSNGGGLSASKVTLYKNDDSTHEVSEFAGSISNGFAFGLGENATGAAGAGGGYNGGWSGNGTLTNKYGAAGGGSGFLAHDLTNKGMYCYRCDVSNDEATKTISVEDFNTNPVVNNAKVGNGYAKITLVSRINIE